MNMYTRRFYLEGIVEVERVLDEGSKYMAQFSNFQGNMKLKTNKEKLHLVKLKRTCVINM